MKFCSNCGKEISGKSSKCFDCMQEEMNRSFDDTTLSDNALNNSPEDSIETETEQPTEEILSETNTNENENTYDDSLKDEIILAVSKLDYNQRPYICSLLDNNNIDYKTVFIDDNAEIVKEFSLTKTPTLIVKKADSIETYESLFEIKEFIVNHSSAPNSTQSYAKKSNKKKVISIIAGLSAVFILGFSLYLAYPTIKLSSAKSAIDSQNYEKAIRILTSMSTTDEVSDELNKAYLNYGKQCYESGEYEKALGLLNNCREANRFNAEFNHIVKDSADKYLDNCSTLEEKIELLEKYNSIIVSASGANNVKTLWEEYGKKCFDEKQYAKARNAFSHSGNKRLEKYSIYYDAIVKCNRGEHAYALKNLEEILDSGIADVKELARDIRASLLCGSWESLSNSKKQYNVEIDRSNSTTAFSNLGKYYGGVPLHFVFVIGDESNYTVETKVGDGMCFCDYVVFSNTNCKQTFFNDDQMTLTIGDEFYYLKRVENSLKYDYRASATFYKYDELNNR